jgi:hypothetical protein
MTCSMRPYTVFWSARYPLSERSVRARLSMTSSRIRAMSTTATPFGLGSPSE